LQKITLQDVVATMLCGSLWCSRHNRY